MAQQHSSAEIVTKQALYVWTDTITRYDLCAWHKSYLVYCVYELSSLSFGKPVFWPAVFDWIAPELVFVPASQCK